jgi:hypothetical protein
MLTGQTASSKGQERNIKKAKKMQKISKKGTDTTWIEKRDEGWSEKRKIHNRSVEIQGWNRGLLTGWEREREMTSIAALNVLLEKTSDWDKDERYV